MCAGSLSRPPLSLGSVGAACRSSRTGVGGMWRIEVANSAIVDVGSRKSSSTNGARSPGFLHFLEPIAPAFDKMDVGYLGVGSIHFVVEVGD